jgi:hypothetical protein
MSIYWSFRGKNEYILIFPGEKLVYTHFSGGEMSRGKNEYVTPDLPIGSIGLNIHGASGQGASYC